MNNNALRLSLLTLLLSVATVAACAGTRSTASPPSEGYVGMSSDAESFVTFEQAVRSADEVALVAVVASTPGRTVTVSTITLPFTNVSMRVVESLRGAPSGSTMVVEQTGGPMPGGTLVSDNDPPYRAGSTHLLLLRKISAGFRIISSLGRNEVIGGVIRPNDHAALPNPFVGKTVGEFMSWAKQLR